MAKNPRKHGDDLRGASRLAVEATKAVTDLVEAMHVTIGSGPSVLGRPLEKPVRLMTGLVYGTVRGVTGLVGGSIDLALEKLAPLLGESAPGSEREAMLAVLNGVLGDYLETSKNPLAIEMKLRHDGEPLELQRDALARELPNATRKLLVLAHGSCMNDLQWRRGGHDHGAALAGAHGFTPVYLHYNSGLHVSTNGRAFALLLEELVRAWPVENVEVTIVAHSMGGLVSRSACLVGEELDHTWRKKLETLVCLGTPHHGAPLERGGNWIDLLLSVSAYSAPLARLGKIRSAGVTDMRYGFVRDEDWQGRDRFAHGKDPRLESGLPAGVECYAMAATLSAEGAKKLASDGLVPVESALGIHDQTHLDLGFPEAHRHVAHGVGHLDLLDNRAVYEKLAEWTAP